LYVTPLNFDDSEITREVPEIVISESDDEWEISNESEQMRKLIQCANEEERSNENSNDELSGLKKNMMLLLLRIRMMIRCQFILTEV